MIEAIWNRAAGAVLILLLAGCAHHHQSGEHPQQSLEAIRIALPWELGILVLDGNGREVMELKPVMDKSRAVDYLQSAFYSAAYTAASVSPQGSTIAAVRCDDMAIYRNASYPPGIVFPAHCELALVDLETQKQTTLFTPSDGRIIVSLAWSRAGDRIAMIVGRDAIVVDSGSGEIVMSWPRVLGA